MKSQLRAVEKELKVLVTRAARIGAKQSAAV